MLAKIAPGSDLHGRMVKHSPSREECLLQPLRTSSASVRHQQCPINPNSSVSSGSNENPDVQLRWDYLVVLIQSLCRHESKIHCCRLVQRLTAIVTQCCVASVVLQLGV